ncbi:MAG TPA: nuclear transport factor 2 family protein [Thermoleophilaceae bacterium]
MTADPSTVATTPERKGETPADRFPIERFRAAMEGRDAVAAMELFTDDCVIRPMGTDFIKFTGKETNTRLVAAVLSCFDVFRYVGEELRTDDMIALEMDLVLRENPPQHLDGLDILKINEEGKCYEMVVQGRPQLAQTLFTGKVALALRPHLGWFRRLLLTVLMPPLELSQKLAGRLGGKLVHDATPNAPMQDPRGRSDKVHPARASEVGAGAASGNGASARSNGSTPASRFPVAEWREAMEARDPERALQYFTDDCLLRPVGTDFIRFQGKDTAKTLLDCVLSVPEKWTYTVEAHTEDTVAVFVRIEFDGLVMDACDLLRINEEGKAYEMFLVSRPQMPVAIFTGKVGKNLARKVGFLRWLLVSVLVWPLEVVQRAAGPFGAWLIEPACPGSPRRVRRWETPDRDSVAAGI